MPDELVALVLGAGASAPYGFPVGRGLVDDICENFPDRYVKLVKHGVSEREYRAMAEELALRLRRARTFSIDSFLAHETNRDLGETGKVAVTMSLLPKETMETLDSPADPGDDWYRHLADSVARGQVELAGVITYNYDRSFEQYLFDALANRYSETEAGKFLLCRTPIVHMHGWFGRPPWQGGDDLHDPPIPYGGLQDLDYRATIIRAASQVRMIYEPQSHRSLGAAAMVLQKADVLVFLGFGYDETSLQRLGLEQNLRSGVPIIGTGYGLSEKQVARAKATLERLSGYPHRSHMVKITPYKNLELIEHCSWLG